MGTESYKTRPTKQIRVICRQQLGDLLLHQPTIECLAQQSGHDVAIVTREGHRPLVDVMPGAHFGNFQPGLRHGRTYCFDGKVYSTLRSLHPRGDGRTLVIPAKKRRLLHRLAFDTFASLDKGMQYTAQAIYRAAGCPPDRFAPPRLLPPPADWLPSDLPADYLLLHPTSAWQRKSWPAAHWIALLAELRLPLPVLLTSGPSDWERAQCAEIAAGLRAAGLAHLNLSGTTSLRQYIALLSQARLTLCVDGSSSHIAAAYRRPTFTLFGPSNPAHWHWPTAYSRCLWAGDYSSERHPAAAAIPPAAAAAALREFCREVQP